MVCYQCQNLGGLTIAVRSVSGRSQIWWGRFQKSPVCRSEVGVQLATPHPKPHPFRSVGAQCSSCVDTLSWLWLLNHILWLMALFGERSTYLHGDWGSINIINPSRHPSTSQAPLLHYLQVRSNSNSSLQRLFGYNRPYYKGKGPSKLNSTRARAANARPWCKDCIFLWKPSLEEKIQFARIGLTVVEIDAQHVHDVLLRENFQCWWNVASTLLKLRDQITE